MHCHPRRHDSKTHAVLRVTEAIGTRSTPWWSRALLSTALLGLGGCIGGTVADANTAAAINGVSVKARTCPTCTDQYTVSGAYRPANHDSDVQGAYRFDPYPEGNGLDARPTLGTEATQFTLAKSGYKTLIFYNTPKLGTYTNQGGESRWGENMGVSYLTKTTEWVDTDSDGLSNAWEARLQTDPADSDTDDDGLGDGVEVLGSSWIDYQSYGANPRHRDLFIEVDYEEFTDAAGAKQSAKLAPAAQTKLLQLFGNLEILNPDGTNGIAVHLVFDDILPQGASCAGEYQSTPDFDAAHRSAFRYARVCVGGGTQVTSGQASGSRFFNRACRVDQDPSNDQTERCVFHQYAVFAHELGHTLGLEHWGGGEAINCKPNYPSMMNYAYDYSFAGSPETLAGTRIQFSKGLLPAIDEVAGVKEVGWAPAGLDVTFLRSYPGTPFRTASVANGTSVDWNRDGSYLGSPKGIVTAGCTRNAPATVLRDFDDIAQIKKGLGTRIPGVLRVL